MKRKFLALPALALAAVTLTGCTGGPSAAEVANKNLSTAADNFEVPRRIVAINTRFPDVPLFSIEGFCSVTKEDNVFFATCLLDRASGVTTRVSVGLSNDVTFINTQIGGKEVSLFRPRIILRPETLIPNFDLSTSSNP